MRDLVKILSECRGGEEIDLSGETIEPFYMRGSNAPQFEEPVTLAGAKCLVPSEAFMPFRFDGARGLRLVDWEISGTDRTSVGLMLHTCKNIELLRPRISGVSHAVNHNMCDHLSVLEPHCWNVRVDGIRGGGASNLTIADGRFWDFFHEDGDHSDPIQGWTLPGSSNSNLRILRNRYDRGEGHPSQGIFLRGTYPNRPQFGTVEVSGNQVSGASYNGIAVMGVTDGQVLNNHVHMLNNTKSWLRVDDYIGEVAGNIAPHFSTADDRLRAIFPAKNTLENIPLPPIKSEAEQEIRTIVVRPGEQVLIVGENR